MDYSYKCYAISIDSAISGVIPPLWLQQNFRSEVLDVFLKWVWLSYSFVILLGSTLVYIFRANTKKHRLSVLLTLSAGLFVHYLLPTEPPWMAAEGAIRINGDYFSKLVKNLIAAMPSIHPAIISLFGCFLWNYGFLGKTTAVVYNVLMLIALVYLGEHYVVDTLVEIFMVIFAWILSGKILIGCSNLKGNHINLVCRLENQLR